MIHGCFFVKNVEFYMFEGSGVKNGMRTSQQKNRNLYLLLNLLTVCATITLQFKFLFGEKRAFFKSKNAGSLFAHEQLENKFCRGNRCYAFFGALLRLRVFFIFRKKDVYEKSIVFASGSGDADWHDADSDIRYRRGTGN
jgi:hypothetical protein